MGIFRWLFGSRSSNTTKNKVSVVDVIKPLPDDKHKFKGESCGYAFYFTSIHERFLHNPINIIERRDDIPKTHGVYGWYFDELPNVPPNDYYNCQGWNLLYIGIAGQTANSKQTLDERIIKKHLKGEANNSTLRLSLGILLRDKFGIELELKEKTKESFWFGERGEYKLSQWIIEHARVAWLTYDDPKEIEDDALRIYGDVLPLNIEGNCTPIL